MPLRSALVTCACLLSTALFISAQKSVCFLPHHQSTTLTGLTARQRQSLTCPQLQIMKFHSVSQASLYYVEQCEIVPIVLLDKVNMGFSYSEIIERVEHITMILYKSMILVTKKEETTRFQVLHTKKPLLFPSFKMHPLSAAKNQGDKENQLRQKWLFSGGLHWDGRRVSRDSQAAKHHWSLAYT